MKLVTQAEERHVSRFLALYVLVCLAVALALAATARGDEEPVFKGKPTSYWIAELTTGGARVRPAIDQFDAGARDCVPALIGAFRGQGLHIRLSRCTPP